jgi:tetratricopeptide (TPR) repeat protein
MSTAVLCGWLIGLGAVTGGCAARQSASLPPAVRSAASPGEPVATIESTTPSLAAAIAAAKNGTTAESLYQVAEEYHRLGVFDQAITFASRALDTHPSKSLTLDILQLRARALRDWGEPELALGDAHRASYLDPRSASAQNTLGTVLYALGKRDEAVGAFERALSIDPTAAWASNNLCYLALNEGDEASAMAHCRAALGIDPGLVVARNNLGLVHAAAGRFDDAAREFRMSGSAAGNYNLGIVLLAKRDYAGALAAFEAVLRVAPNSDAAFIRAQEARALANQQRAR